MTRLDLTEDTLTRHLGDALRAEARRHPLPADYATSIAGTIPDRAPRSLWSWTSSAVATVVVAIAAVALVLAIAPRLVGPGPGSSSAPSDQQTPDPRAVIDCHLPSMCDEVADAASRLLPSGPSTWFINFGRGLGFHAEVHACYPGGDYYLVDVFERPASSLSASLRSSGWADPPCQADTTPAASASPSASPTAPPGGLSQAQAVAAAEVVAERSNVVVMTAVAGPASEVLAGSMVHVYPDMPSGDTWVWVINLWNAAGEQGTVVVLDYLDGTIYGIQDWIS